MFPHRLFLSVLAAGWLSCLFASSGGASEIRLTNDPEDSILPSVAVGPDGSAHIAWIANSKLMYLRVDSAGKTIVPKLELYSIVPASFPRIAVNSANHAYVVCQINSLLGLICVEVDAAGQKLYHKLLHISAPGVTTQQYSWPAIAIDPTTDLPVVVADWHYTIPGQPGEIVWVPVIGPIQMPGSPDFHAESMVGLRLDGQASIKSRFSFFYQSASSPLTDLATMPAVVVDKAGRVHAVWNHQEKGKFQIAYRYWDAKDFWIISSSVVTPTSRPDIAYDGRGLHVAWANTAGVHYAALSPSASTTADGTLPLDIGDSLVSSTDAKVVGNASIAANQSKVDVVWSDSRHGKKQIYFRSCRLSSTAWGDELSLTAESANSSGPAMSLTSDATPRIVWQGDKYGNYELLSPPVPIMLVYGWHGSERNWELIKAFLEIDGYPVQVLHYDDSLAPAGAAAQLETAVDQLLHPDRDTNVFWKAVNLIGHSYGGLVARHFVEQLGHDNLVNNLTMIATPNHGSKLADYLSGTLTDKPAAGLVEYFFDIYSALFRADRSWGSTLALRTLQNPYDLDQKNLALGLNLSKLRTRYFVIAGTQPYPPKFTSHRTFLPGPDDGAVAVRSARLPGIPLYCVPQNHSAIVNPRLVSEWYDRKTGDFVNTAALDRVLEMYTGIIRPILEGVPPAAEPNCADALDPFDDQPMLDILTQIHVGVRKGDILSRPFDISIGSPVVSISFTFRFSEFDFSLRDPSGQSITKDTVTQLLGAQYSETSNAMSYTVPNPAPGQWKFVLRVLDVPELGEDIDIFVMGQGPADQTQPPRLQAELAGGQIALSWIASSANYLIESRAAFIPTTTWMPLTNQPVIEGDRWTLTLPATNSAAFYRLRRP